MAAALADLLAAPGDRLGRPAQRAAGEAGVGQRPGERAIPGGGEAARVGPCAQAIGGLPTHAHDLGRRDHAADVGQREDEHGLALWRPSVAARADGDGGEVEVGAHR